MIRDGQTVLQANLAQNNPFHPEDTAIVSRIVGLQECAYKQITGEACTLCDDIVSFTAHMPDTLEMPYRPRVRGASAHPEAGAKNRYRLGGVSCLSGDFMMEYAFEQPLKVGQKIVFEDMIHYTMVKTTTFNGVTHPSIAIWRENGVLDLVRKFGYNDYKRRLS
jgi:hypothetical protein